MGPALASGAPARRGVEIRDLAWALRDAVRHPDGARPAFGRRVGPTGIMMSGMAPRPILLLDAFSLLYRAFFALPALTTRAGEPTSGLYGLSVLLLKLLRERRPKGAVFAIDLPRPTFRHERWDGYKASRQRPPSALGQQVG